MAQNNPPLTHTHTFPACLCVPAHPPERAEHRSGQRWLSPPVSLSISILCVRVSAVRVINVDDINSVKYLAAIWSVTASGSPVHVAFAPHSPQHPSKAKMCKKWNLKKKKHPGLLLTSRHDTELGADTEKNDTLFHTWKTWRAALGCNWQNTKRKSTTYSIPRRKNAKPSQL